MKNRKEKIAAVVVTYNRKQLLKECLDALLSQTYPLDSIIVIDNASTDMTLEFLSEQGYLDNPKIDYVRLSENIGSSGGFYEGMKRGYEKGYDWLWLMDDDAEPKEDALEKLEPYFLLDNIVALACLTVYKNMNIIPTHRGYLNFKNVLHGMIKEFDRYNIKKKFIEVHYASFVGILVNSKAIKKVGLPKKELFFHFDDVEYSTRLHTVGKILLVFESVIIHKEAAKKGRVEKSFLGIRKKRIVFDKFWMQYYDIRNLVWLRKKYFGNNVLFYIQIIKSTIRSIPGIILFDDYKYKRIKLILSAYFDGLKGNFDNNKPKRILYGK